MTRHRRRTPDPELAALRDASDIAVTEATALRGLLTEAQGRVAWETARKDEAQAEVRRLADELAEANADLERLMPWTDMLEQTRDCAHQEVAELRAEVAKLNAKILDLHVDLHDAYEGDPQGRLLAAWKARVELAEDVAAHARTNEYAADVRALSAGTLAVGDLRAELAKAEKEIGRLETEAAKRERQGVYAPVVVPGVGFR